MEETVPSGVQKILDKHKLYFTKESRDKGLSFKPRPTDVILCPAVKSGTTWVQQICHGLRSRGDMTFDEITLAIPCLELAHDYGYTNLEAKQAFEPRMFLTHLWYPHCPKGAGKYIVITRQPSDSALSFYHFFKNWFFSEDEVSLDDFVKWFYLKRDIPKTPYENSSQMHHILSWYPHRHDENVLWLHFEDLKQNLRECVRLIAEFLDVGKDDQELQELVAEQVLKASFEFMKNHRTKFDGHPLIWHTNIAAGLHKDAGLNNYEGKVRSGRVNESREVLSEDILNAIDQKWKDVFQAATGYETYDAMRAGINEELGRKFV